MTKVYYYPSCPPGGYGNPYSENFKKALGKYGEVLDKENLQSKPAVRGLLRYCFKADLFVLNWIEGIGNHQLGFVQFPLAFLCLLIIKIRKRKIVWTLHNIHPHSGSKFLSKLLSKYLFRYADIIIAHSNEARQYALGKARCPVYYVCHPFNQLEKKTSDEVDPIDVLLWGSIYPYKGITQFLNELNKRHLNLVVKIIGKCSDAALLDEIGKNVESSPNVTFENRRPEFDELAMLISSARYVLFPYIGDSISSSGALMDTIAMGGVPIGPNMGAFKDLNEEGLCVVYNNYDELFAHLEGDFDISEDYIACFVKANSWDNFAKFVFEKIYS